MALASWIGVSALAAGPDPRRDHWIGIPSLSGLVTVVVLIAMVVGLVLFITVLVTGPKQGNVTLPPRRRLWPQIVLLIVVVFVLSQIRLEDRPEPEEPVAPPTPPPTDEPADGGEAVPVISRPELGVVIVVLLASAAVVVWTRSLSRRAELAVEAADPDLVELLTPVVAGAARSLRLGDDPRTAVMMAYAELEAALAELGHPPAPTETPTEHLRRVLARLPVDPAPLLDLARLHELARFSDHAVTAVDQRAAARSLAHVVEQLGALAEGSSPSVPAATPARW